MFRKTFTLRGAAVRMKHRIICAILAATCAAAVLLAAKVYAGYSVGDPPSPEPSIGLEQARAEFKLANPDTQMGEVKVVRPKDHLVGVVGVPEHGMERGDAVTIIDATPQFNAVTESATVELSMGNLVIVKYEGIKRLPRVGDFVVRIPFLPHVHGKIEARSGAPAAPAYCVCRKCQCGKPCAKACGP